MPSVGKKVRIGRTKLEVTPLGLGTVALGFLYHAISEQEAYRTVERALELGIGMFDTAPLYGDGVAETRLGSVLKSKARDRFSLATKVGFDIQPGDRALVGFQQRFYVEGPRDYSYDGVLRNLDRSLKRLQLDRVDIVHIHDADDHFTEAMEGAYRALDRLRGEGVIGAVGAGMNQTAMLERFARAGNFDCFLVAGRYTLLDQSALEGLFPVCQERGISIFLGGVYNSGILADPGAQSPHYNYAPAARELVARARKIDAICRRHGVPIKAAALQFSSAPSVVASVLPGARSPEEAEESERLFRLRIPSDLWAELREERLIAASAPIPAEDRAAGA